MKTQDNSSGFASMSREHDTGNHAITWSRSIIIASERDRELRKLKDSVRNGELSRDENVSDVSLHSRCDEKTRADQILAKKPLSAREGISCVLKT